MKILVRDLFRQSYRIRLKPDLHIKDGVTGSKPNLWKESQSHQSTLASQADIKNNKSVMAKIDQSDIFAESLTHPDYFGVSKLFTMEDLFEANVHLGHREGTLCIFMKPYIFGSRLNHLIFDLEQTKVLLQSALNFTAHIAFRQGIILFVCRSPQHQLLVDKTAEECGEFSHTKPWEEGTLTNSTAFFRCETRLPDLVIALNTFTDVMTQHRAIVEAAKMLIPTVGIADTNCDPRIIAYPVPGNDDSASAISLYCRLFKTAIFLGKNKRKELIHED